jgi:hypothetical protein
MENNIDLLKLIKDRTNEIDGIICKDLIKLPYGIVKEVIPELLNNSMELESYINYLPLILGINKIKETDHNKLFSFSLWLAEEYKLILELERNLETEPDIKLLQAGIQNINKFGIKVTLDSLASGKLKDYDYYYNLPYEKVFDKLLLDKEINKIKSNLNKIK